MAQKNIVTTVATTTAKVIRTGVREVFADTNALIAIGALGITGGIALGAALRSREIAAQLDEETVKDLHLRDKSIAGETWDMIGPWVKQVGITLGCGALLSGLTEEVLLPALRKKWPDKYPA